MMIFWSLNKNNICENYDDLTFTYNGTKEDIKTYKPLFEKMNYCMFADDDDFD